MAPVKIWSTKLVARHSATASMRQVNMHEAKTHLSRLVEEAAAGEAFVICKAGRPMVRVSALEVPGQPLTQRRRLGLLLGQCAVPDDFDRMAEGEIAGLFEATTADS
jgi:antitoxin (DNA-binding transcriptional repressor) of toxin-antitoxin stability system